MDAIFICGANFRVPTFGADARECPEVMWSNGKSCRKCPKKDCYRNGWLVKQVTADNKKLRDSKAVSNATKRS
jgi:hypothetical protein